MSVIFRSTRSFQNAAACLITDTSQRAHITPVLRQLHWLPVRHRVDFKLAVLVFKALHRLARQYLAEDCQLVTAAGRRQLRSSDALTCVIQRTRTRLGDRSFAVAGPRLWYSLPAELRHLTISLGEFHRALKMHLFLN